MKTYYKSVCRMLRKNISRFLSIVLIVLIGIGLTSGVGSVTGKIKNSLSDFAHERNVADLTVKSSADGGFTEEQIRAIRDAYGEDNVDTASAFDVYLNVGGERRLTRLYFSDDPVGRTINRLSEKDAVSYETGDDTYAGYAEVADKNIRGYAVGDTVVLDFADIYEQLAEQNGTVLSESQKMMFSFLPKRTVTVVGIVNDPRFFAKDGEPSYLNDDTSLPSVGTGTSSMITLDDILYLPFSALPLPSRNEITIALSGVREKDLFSPSYDSITEKEEEAVKALLKENGAEEDSITVLTLSDNYSFYSLNTYAEKVTALSAVLMVAFMFLTALVVLSNMTRLMDEERSQTACLVSLGYSASTVTGKYLLFALAATAIGGFAGYFVGTGLCSFIYLVFDYSYTMPPETDVFAVTFFFLTFAFIIAAVVFATLTVGRKTSNETPAELLRPKAPKAGKKVLPERIPALWNRLSFKYKSSVRNVLRYRGRFLMTVAAVAGSMGLVMAGLALLDLCLFGDFGNGAIAGLAVVIVAFAALLTLTAIYTITGISISERNREIATLMVLGYDDAEVCGYIYREVYIDTAVGILFGYGVGAFLIWLVFRVMGFGSVGDVSWYVWLIAPVLILLFTSLVTLILRRRIVTVDMNASLKALE